MHNLENLKVHSKQDYFSKEDDQKDYQDLQVIEQKQIDFSQQFNEDTLVNNTEQIQTQQSTVNHYRSLLLSLQSKFESQYLPPEKQSQSQHQNHKNVQQINKLTDQSFEKNNTKKTLQILQNKLTSKGFIIFKDSKIKLKQNRIQIKVLQKYYNYQIIEIFCQLGRYSKKFIVLYVKDQSFRHRYHPIGHGTFGQVFGCKSLENKKIATKCLKFKKSQIKESLNKIIQEFFIADIMSATEIGPQIFKRSGFDIILFQNCIEFEMELCSEIKINTVINDLNLNLFKMHLLKIVHSDIKPANIMFSECYKKNVFFDFGVASVLDKEIWQKTQTKFKGTYEFTCSEMKRIFLNHQKGRINMYLNDVQILMNSIRRLYVQRQFQVQSFFSPLGKQNSILSENLKQQIVFQFKYHLYCFLKNQIVTPQFHYFLRKMSKLLSQRQVSYIRQKIKYLLVNLKQSSKQTIIQNTFLKGQQNQQMYNIICDFLFHQSQDFYMQFDIVQINQKSKQRDEIQIFFDEVQTDVQNSQENLNMTQFNQNKQFYCQNLKYILHSVEQIMKFTKQQYFQLFLEYTSFWKSSAKTSIEQKQSVAKIFKSLFDNEDIQSHKYLQISYLPQQIYIKDNCKNLVWVYGYLLSFFMESQLQDWFKANNLITVLKDCIFMCFKYDMFLVECLQKYICFLINNQKDMLITLTVIQCFEFLYLTTKHFLVETTRLKPNKQKSLFLIKKVLFQANDYLQNQNKNLQYSGSQNKDSNIFLNIWRLFGDKDLKSQTFSKENQNLKNKRKQNISNLASVILEQFCESKNLEKICIFQRSMRLIYFSNIEVLQNDVDCEKIFSFQSLHQYSSFENHFDVLRLIRLDEKTTQQVQENVGYIQQKINCPNISKYFILPQLFFKYSDKKDYVKIQSILTIVYGNFQSALINFNIFIKISKERIKLAIFSLNTRSKNYIKKKRNMILKTIEYFTQDPKKYKNQLLRCVHYISSAEFLDANNNNLSFENIQEIKEVFQKLFFHSYLQTGTNLLTMMVGFHMLTNLRQNQKMKEKYLKFRLQLFRLILQQQNRKLQKIENRQNNYLQKLFGRQKLGDFSLNKHKEFEGNIKYLDFNDEKEQMFENSLFIMSGLSRKHQQDETIYCETYYKIKKIKTFLFQKFKVSQYGGQIIDFLVQKSMLNEIFGLIVQFSIETYDTKSAENYTLFSCEMNFLKDKLTKDQQIYFAQQFISYLFKLQIRLKLILSPIILFPIYLHMLHYESYLYQQPQIHQKLLLKVIFLKQKFSLINLNLSRNIKNSMSQFTVKNHFDQEIMFLSLRFAKKWKGKRKKRIIIRQFLKILTEIRPQFKKYLNYFVSKSFTSKQSKELQKSLISLYEKKAKRFLQNLYVFETYFNNEQQQVQNQGWYYSYFGKNEITIKNGKEKTLQIRKQKYYTQFQRDIINQTILIRNKLLDYEYLLLCQKLKKEKGMEYEQISWIKKLNKK